MPKRLGDDILQDVHTFLEANLPNDDAKAAATNSTNIFSSLKAAIDSNIVDENGKNTAVNAYKMLYEMCFQNSLLSQLQSHYPRGYKKIGYKRETIIKENIYRCEKMCLAVDELL